jgi:hypothetical protein
MAGVIFACLSGIFFGALNITMRRGLDRLRDVDAAAVVIAGVGLAASAPWPPSWPGTGPRSTICGPSS